MKLFDEIERTETRPSQNREQSYSYLNLSARPMAELIRNTLEQWFEEYPEEHRASLKNDMMTQNDQSAFTELLMHQVLKQFGEGDIIIHPNIPDTEKKPDFKVALGGGEVVFEVKNSLDTENPRIEEFCDNLNERYSTTGYMLDLSFEGDFDNPISVKKFIQFAEAQAEQLDLPALSAQVGNFDQIPTWVFSSGSDRIHIKPIPCRDLEKVYESPVGMTSPHSAYMVDHAGTLRKSLKKKASRYGELNMPYIIVLNFEEGFLDNIDTAQALFGTEQFIFGRRQNGEPDFSRANDGLWADSKNTRVSGVLVINSANPWSFWKRTPVLWLNPWAAHPLDTTHISGNLTFKEANREAGRLEQTDGRDFSGILNLNLDEWETVFNQ
nr:hypothetical protein [Cytophagales bacterium]